MNLEVGGETVLNKNTATQQTHRKASSSFAFFILQTVWDWLLHRHEEVLVASGLVQRRVELQRC